MVVTLQGCTKSSVMSLSPPQITSATAFAVAALLSLGLGPRLLRRAHVTAHWESVAAEVIASEADYERTLDDPRGRWRNTIQYRYNFGGRAYECRQRSPRGASRHDERDEALRDAPAVGEYLIVYVDPEDPSRTAYRRGSYIVGVSVIVLGGIFALLGAVARRVGRTQRW